MVEDLAILGVLVFIALTGMISILFVRYIIRKQLNSPLTVEEENIKLEEELDEINRSMEV